MKILSTPLDRTPPPSDNGGARAKAAMEPSGPVKTADPGASNGATTSNSALADALDAIQSLVPPDPGSAQWLPASYWNSMQSQYNDDVIAIAGAALESVTPPTLDDFGHLSPQLAEVALAEATQRYLELRSDVGDALASASIDNLRMDPAFQGLPPETRAQVRELVQAHRTDPDTVALLVRLAASDGFQSLGADGQRALLLLIGGHDGLAEAAREDLATMFSCADAGLLDGFARDPVNTFWFGTPDDVQDLFNALASMGIAVPEGPNALPWYRETRSEGIADRSAADHSIGEPTLVTDHDFGSGAGDAWRYEVTIGGRTIEVFLPADQPAGSRTADIERIATALAATPGALLDPITRVDVNPETDGTGIMNANSGTGLLRINPDGMALESDNDFFSGILHECGHLLDAAGTTLDDGRTLDNAWDEAMASDGLAVSQAANANEDFADAVALYLLADGTPDQARLRELFPDRFAIIEQLIG